MVIRSPYPDIAIPEQDILTYLFGSGESLPDDPVWIDAADTKQYLSLSTALQWAKRLAVGLEKLGLKKNEVVLTVTPNQIFVPVAYLGIIGSGRIFSGANPASTADEMSYQMRDTGAAIVLVYPDLLNTARKAAKQAGQPEDRIYLFSELEHKPVDGIKDWRSMIGSHEEAAPYQWPTLNGSEVKKQVATINYSSGTTGLPKGVMITHSNLVANVEQTIMMRKMTSGEEIMRERWIGLLPLFHAYGQWNAILLAAKLRNWVYVMKTFIYEDYLQRIQTHKITDLQVAPPILVLLSKHPATAKYDLSSVRGISSGAAPLSQSLQSECATRFKTNVKQGWGMTELTCCGLMLPTGIEDETGSVGFLLPNSEVKLLDEKGQEVATGERGEIFIRGPNVSPGYWKNEKATKETMLEGGWLRTGDVAICDERGMFWIVDRLKELIKVSGLQVAPAELEAILLTHPAIADAGVVGISDSFDGQEKPRAYVQLKEAGSTDAEGIQRWMQTKVAKHKFLTGGIVFVGTVPKSPAGKIQRKILREWAKNDTQQGKVKL